MGVDGSGEPGWEAWPTAWVIPAEQENASGLAYVLRILRTADVEVHRATRDFQGDGRLVSAGSYVIPMNQPYAAFAQTMLEVQVYPDLREYPGGPPRRPYDVTAHTLGLLMDVETFSVDSVEGDLMSALDGPAIERPEFAFDLPDALEGSAAPRIGVYKSWQEPMEGGWTRWVFDQHGLQYDTIKDERLRRGGLGADYDVILLQDQSATSIRDGYAEGQVPDEYTGGIGTDGATALAEFVRGGGRIVAIEESTEFVVDLLDLGVTNEVERLPSQEFFIPGSILEVNLAEGHPVNAGMGDRTPVWYWGSSRAFGVDQPNARIVASYAEGDPLMSGWVLGGQYLAGKPAVVEIPVGEGSVILFGFQPNYRAQTVATWPLLFNALNAKVIF